jgi:hypothetical protein
VTDPKSPTPEEIADIRERLGELFQYLTPSEQVMLHRAHELGLIAAMTPDERKAFVGFLARLIDQRRRAS